jgi:hypothetical protein
MMAIYNPRQGPSRSSTKKGWTHKIGTLLGALLPKKKTAPFQTQPLVTGAQRVWKLKRFSKMTVMFVVAACGLAAALWLSSQLFLRSDIFRLTDIRVSGTRTLVERQILELAGLQQGGSLLRFNVKEAEARIVAHPWVEQAEIKIHWPSAVDIAIRENQPFAMVNIEENKEKRLRYINREGHVFAEVGQGQELDFPVITGVLLAKDIASDRFVKGGLADAACTVLLLAAKGNAILPIQSVSEVHIDPQQGLIVYLTDRPFPVYFGKDRLQTKFFRLVKVLEQLYAKKQVDTVKEIRMDYADDKILVTGAKIDE